MEIVEDYVNFNQAKLLKAKGFDEECSEYYLKDGINYSYPNPENWNLKIDTISRPEQHQVVEWLRVNHGIWIQTPYSYNDGNVYCWTICKINEIESEQNCWLSGLDTEIVGYASPQEAYSAAFDYVLTNLI
jgi:hypothetical protein